MRLMLMRSTTCRPARRRASRLAPRLRLSSAVWLVLASSTALLGAADSAQLESRLRETVAYLASDELEGRGIDTAGIQKAADYLAAQFQAAGLSTSVFDGNAFQPFVVSTGAELGPREENRLVLRGPAPPAGGSPSTMELKLGESFSPLAIGGTGEVQSSRRVSGIRDLGPATPVRRLCRSGHQGKGRRATPQGATAGESAERFQRTPVLPGMPILPPRSPMRSSRERLL